MLVTPAPASVIGVHAAQRLQVNIPVVDKPVLRSDVQGKRVA